MTNQTARNNVFTALDAHRFAADLAARPYADQVEQLAIAIDSAVKSAAMYRNMNRLADANYYADKAQRLVAEYRAAIAAEGK